MNKSLAEIIQIMEAREREANVSVAALALAPGPAAPLLLPSPDGQFVCVHFAGRSKWFGRHSTSGLEFQLVPDATL